MGTDHGKKKDDEKKSKIKKPLRKPKAIDKIREQSAKATVSDAKKKSQQVKKKQSKKTTVTDTQKRGQVRQRYDLYEGTDRPLKEPTKKPSKKQPTKFLPHVIKPLYKPKEETRSKNKSGVMV